MSIIGNAVFEMNDFNFVFEGDNTVLMRKQVVFAFLVQTAS